MGWSISDRHRVISIELPATAELTSASEGRPHTNSAPVRGALGDAEPPLGNPRL